MVRVVVVDDHPLFRDGVASLVTRSRRHELVGKGIDASDALRLVKEARPDVLLLDLLLPGDGLSVISTIRSDYPDVKVVILTCSEEEAHVSKALSLGAHGYILKEVGGNQLLDTIDAIHRGGTYVTPTLAARLLHQMTTRREPEASAHDVSALTRREEEILDKVATGSTNKEIGAHFNISEKTVKHYMTNILDKLQVRNRVEAAIIARHRKGESEPRSLSAAVAEPADDVSRGRRNVHRYTTS